MKSWLFVLLIVITNAYTAPLHAQVISDKLGQIERGFWTRPISNRIRLEEGTLEIHREYRTIVEWSEPGVPFRSVTDTLVWRLPLNSISEVRIYDAPGSVLLEGGDKWFAH